MLCNRNAIIQRSLFKLSICTLTALFISCNLFSADRFWVGGSGNWNDNNHWSDKSGGSGGASLPDPDSDVFFDIQSGLTSTSTITILEGEYNVRNFKIADASLSFKFYFSSAGSSPSSSIDFNIYGDLFLAPNINTEFHTPNFKPVKLNLVGPGIKTLHTYGININELQSKDEHKTVNLLSDLNAVTRILFRKGNLNTNGYDIFTDVFDAGGSCSGLNCPAKVFDFDGSTVECRIFREEFNYGLLTLNGSFTLKTASLSAQDLSLDQVELISSFTNTFSVSFGLENGSVNSILIDTDLDVLLRGPFTVEQNIEILAAREIKILGTITLNGFFINAILPNCNNLLKIYEGTLHKTSGSVSVKNALIRNVSTSGGATFYASNCIVYETEADWNVQSPPSLTYYWIGGDGLWSESTNWSLQSGGSPITTGCIPSITDDVIIDKQSFSANNQSIRVSNGEGINCRNLTWNVSSFSGLEFELPTSGPESEINILGSLRLDPSVSVISAPDNEFIFYASDAEIEAQGILLPTIRLDNLDTDLDLMTDLHCEEIVFSKGTFNSNGRDVVADRFYVESGPSNSANINLGFSDVNISGAFDLSNGAASYQVNLDADEANIICGSFDSDGGDFYQLEITNTSGISYLRDVINIDRLILSGNLVDVGFTNLPAGETTIGQLVLNSPNANLRIKDTDGVNITESIRSNYATAKISAEGSLPGKINIPVGICAEGALTFEDIDVVGGSINAPDGINGGGNSNISFQTYADEGKLYWIGREGSWTGSNVWSFGSGACPAGHGPISDYDSLIFDNNSFIPGEQDVYVNSNSDVRTLMFRNTDLEATIHIPSFFDVDRIYLDGGKASFKDSSIPRDRLLLINEEVHALNGANLTIDSAAVVFGYKPDQLSKTTLKVASGSNFIGKSSLLAIAGHGTGVKDNTVDFEGSNLIDIADCSLVTVSPMIGQSQNNMIWNLKNGTEVEEISIQNSAGANQKITLLSEVKTKVFRVKYSTFVVSPSASLDVEK